MKPDLPGSLRTKLLAIVLVTILALFIEIWLVFKPAIYKMQASLEKLESEGQVLAQQHEDALAKTEELQGRSHRTVSMLRRR